VRKRGIAEGFLSGFGLTCVRVVFGYFWLSRVVASSPPTFGCPAAGFCLTLAQAIHSPSSAIFGTLLEIVVQPHVLLFAWVATLFELAAGLSIFLGILTRLGALVGLLWSLAFLIGMSGVPGESAWYYLSLVLLSIVFFAIGGSNQLSVDQLARWRTWWGAAY
jgi:uncharacterized membrane protein YphA (DoxX/SURF4 family)